MEAKFKIIILMALIVFVSGCIKSEPTNTQKQGLMVNADPDPKTIFEGSSTALHFDVKNNGEMDYYDTVIELFDTGVMRVNNTCFHNFGTISPGELQTFTCLVGVGNTNKKSNALNYRAKFRTYTTATPMLKLISEDEYLKRKTTGKLNTLGRSFSYGDNNVKIDVSFSESLPIIDEKGRIEYMHIDIKNVGNGYVDPILNESIAIVDLSAGQLPSMLQNENPENENTGGIIGVIRSLFQIDPTGTITPNAGKIRQASIKTCNKPKVLNQINGEFTRITCTVPLNGQTEFIQNHQLLIVVVYDYEVRGSANINIEQKR